MGDVGKEKSKFTHKNSALSYTLHFSIEFPACISDGFPIYHPAIIHITALVILISWYIILLLLSKTPAFLHLSSVSRFLSTATDSLDSSLLLFLLPALFFSFLPQFGLISLCLYLSFHLPSSLILI